MADPICRWRNPYLNTVQELLDWLPKTELSKSSFRSVVKTAFNGAFVRTAYQLACQLGLYYESDNHYFPKFTYQPSRKDLEKYLENWVVRYPVPNPYTPSLKNNRPPFSIHAKICERLTHQKEGIFWDETLRDIFDEELGNLDILRNTINTYSPVLKVEQLKGYKGEKRYIILLEEGVSYKDLNRYINIDISLDRTDKQDFFDLFQVPYESQLDLDSYYKITKEERNILNEIEQSDLTSTEKLQLAKARIGQGKFRRLLFEEGLFCPFTGIDHPKLLIASHIKPWRDAENIERLDPKNGLLLTPTYDKLFDKGWISFTSDKRLLVARELGSQNIDKLNLKPGAVISSLQVEGRQDFLDYHRKQASKIYSLI